MKSSPTQIIKWLRTRKQGSSLPNREKAADLIEELQAAVIASQSRIAELEQANNREILDSSNHVRDATKMVTDRQLADAVNELRDIAIKYHSAGQLRATVAVDAGVLEAIIMRLERICSSQTKAHGPLWWHIEARNALNDARRMLAVGEPGAGDAVKALRELLAASDAVIERWHAPLWKDAKPTAEYIAALRLAAESARKQLARGE